MFSVDMMAANYLRISTRYFSTEAAAVDFARRMSARYAAMVVRGPDFRKIAF